MQILKSKITWLLIFTLLLITTSGCSLKASNRLYNNAVKQYEDGNYEEAEVLFLEAISKNKDKADFFLDYGFTLIQLSRYDEAIEQFGHAILDKDIIMIKENNKYAYRGMGIAYYCMGEYDSAIKNFDSALLINELSELDMDILSYKGSALELSGKLEGALEVYTKMLENGIELAGLYRIRGDNYRRQGAYEESLKDYDKALTMEKGDFNLYFGKFAVLKELGRNEEAVEALSKAGEIYVSTDQDKFDLAKVHYYKEDYAEARIQLEQLILKGFTEAHYFLGEICMSEGSYSEASQEFENYLDEGNPASAMLYNQMVTSCLFEKNYEKAEVYLQKAKQLNDLSMKKQLTRNEIIYLEYTGDFTAAYDLMVDYLNEYPEDEEAYNDFIFLKTRVTENNKEDTETGQTTVKP